MKKLKNPVIRKVPRHCLMAWRASDVSFGSRLMSVASWSAGGRGRARPMGWPGPLAGLRASDASGLVVELDIAGVEVGNRDA